MMLLTFDVKSMQNDLFTLYAWCDMSRCLKGQSYKIVLVKFCHLSFPWVCKRGGWVFPWASHESSYFWLLLHIYLPWLTSYSHQTYLDGLFYASNTEMRYLCYYYIKRKQQNVKWLLNWLCQNNGNLVNTSNNFPQALRTNANNDIIF